MAGGVGSRFWPMSTSARPKQFMDVLGTGKSLLQMTFERSKSFCPTDHIFISTNEDYRALVQEHLPDLPAENILCEPARRNTAPCVAYGCFKIDELNPNARILVAPSDHLILNKNSFTNVINKAFEESDKGSLITLGIKTTRPDTGYGYIHANGTEIDQVTKVHRFTEKPDIDLAVEFHEQGDYFWNSGMFVWSSRSVIKAFKLHSPQLHDSFEKLRPFLNTADEKAELNNMYPECENISIDYAIMESANNVYTIPCDIGWTDLGTWGALYGILDKDDSQNAGLNASVALTNAEKNIIVDEENKLIAIDGLEDFIVVNSKKALLICPKKNEQAIKQIVEKLKKDEETKHLT